MVQLGGLNHRAPDPQSAYLHPGRIPDIPFCQVFRAKWLLTLPVAAGLSRSILAGPVAKRVAKKRPRRAAHALPNASYSAQLAHPEPHCRPGSSGVECPPFLTRRLIMIGGFEPRPPTSRKIGSGRKPFDFIGTKKAKKGQSGKGFP